MACFHPIRGWRTAEGKITTKWGKGNFTDLPPIRINCGRCQGCRLERSRNWALRIMHESKMHEPWTNWFITLTYSDENLPENGNLELPDWQKFAKRWRKNHGSFRYYGCGEYGSQTERPHYHACVFGMDLGETKVGPKSRKGNAQFESERLTDTWKLGRTMAGRLTWQSASYVARYIMQKQTGETAEEHYKTLNIDTGEEFQRVPEFNMMSKRPGIGKTWFDAHNADVYKHDQVPVRVGKTSRPPKYYDKLRKELEEEGSACALRLEAVKSRRRAAAIKWNAKNGEERLKVKENRLARLLSEEKREI